MNDEIKLTEAQIDAIAERAAQKALRLVYAEVGREALKRLLWALGAIVIAGIALLFGSGRLP